MTRRGVISLALLLLAPPALLVAGVLASGWLLAVPHQRAVGAAPADLGAENVVFRSPSGSAIHGWLVPGRPGTGAVLVLHGIRADRGEMLGRIRLLHAAGYALLAIDLQAHGESQGRHITFGHLEALDAAAAIHFLREKFAGERVGAIGVSLGGAACLLGPRPLPVDALVLEQVFADIDSALTNRLVARLGPPGRWVAPLYERLMPLVLPVRPAELRPIDHIGAAAAPVLMIVGAADRYTPLAESRALFARAREPKVRASLTRAPLSGRSSLARASPRSWSRSPARRMSISPRARPTSIAAASSPFSPPTLRRSATDPGTVVEHARRPHAKLRGGDAWRALVGDRRRAR
jgi:pimeloyl-ACP methyl ester carboxylesterase